MKIELSLVIGGTVIIDTEDVTGITTVHYQKDRLEAIVELANGSSYNFTDTNLKNYAIINNEIRRKLKNNVIYR